MSILKFIIVSVLFVLSNLPITASAEKVQCTDFYTVDQINTWYYKEKIDNGDKDNKFSVKLGNGKWYSAPDGCNTNDSCGQANFSLLLAAFSSGSKVSLVSESNTCDIFWGVFLKR